MTQYLYQAAYTPESLIAQMKNPADRLAQVGAMLEQSVGAKIIGGGFSFGEYDIAVIVEAADDTTMAAVAMPPPPRSVSVLTPLETSSETPSPSKSTSPNCDPR